MARKLCKGGCGPEEAIRDTTRNFLQHLEKDHIQGVPLPFDPPAQT